MNAIVVGTDGSPNAEAAIQKVIELAGGTDATVHLVCAYPGRTALERLGMTAKQDPVDMRGVAADLPPGTVTGAGPYAEGPYEIPLPITAALIERLNADYRASFEPRPPVK